MSARGYHSGSRQRRSSSLTSLTSRPSIGVAQRVSGAAFDRVRSSGGASMMLLLMHIDASVVRFVTRPMQNDRNCRSLFTKITIFHQYAIVL